MLKEKNGAYAFVDGVLKIVGGEAVMKDDGVPLTDIVVQGSGSVVKVSGFNTQGRIVVIHAINYPVLVQLVRDEKR